MLQWCIFAASFVITPNECPFMNDYQPVSCQFYDELEAMATLRKPIAVVFLNPLGQAQSLQGKIKDLYSRYKAEFLVLDDGTEIRLDRILQVNGKRPVQYC